MLQYAANSLTSVIYLAGYTILIDPEPPGVDFPSQSGSRHALAADLDMKSLAFILDATDHTSSPIMRRCCGDLFHVLSRHDRACP